MSFKLNLDFALSTYDERLAFINEYIKQKSDWTSKELETMSNYVFYGKLPNGKTFAQEHNIHIDTKYSDWNADNVVSLESLFENPTFSEAQLHPLGTQLPVVSHRHSFSRKEALDEAPEPIRAQFIDLFREIDRTDLLVELYELTNEKRDKPIRDSLLRNFSMDEVNNAQIQATFLSEYNYLKLRHHLIELRRKQYTLRDSYKPSTGLEQTTTEYVEDEPTSIGFNVEVRPLGLWCYKFFKSEEQIAAAASRMSDEEQKNFVREYWALKDKPKGLEYFDFENPEHLAALVKEWDNIQGSLVIYSDESENRQLLLKTFNYYVDLADLGEMKLFILEQKKKGISNQKIVQEVNKKWKKNYSSNYISTIYTQKILTRIADAATYQCEMLENLVFPENFQKCSKCGRVFLIHERNFVKRANSKTNFSSRCKCCDKLSRTT